MVKTPKGNARERPRLTSAAIVAAAMRLADAEGLEAVSIRRVAAELEARAMSLYDHFESKQDLLVSMVDEGVGEMLTSEPPPEDWREAIAVSARFHAASTSSGLPAPPDFTCSTWRLASASWPSVRSVTQASQSPEPGSGRCSRGTCVDGVSVSWAT